MSKVIEKVAAAQVIQHVEKSGTGEIFQSAYKTLHSTETALLKVKTDILNHLDANEAAFLVLLDMSAAFDTVDHNILVNRLDNRFGITGQVKSWFQSYLSSRTIQVKIQQDLSRSHTMNYSLPQGSIIGPRFHLICFTRW